MIRIQGHLGRPSKNDLRKDQTPEVEFQDVFPGILNKGTTEGVLKATGMVLSNRWVFGRKALFPKNDKNFRGWGKSAN
jgi:hypothetical protein